MQIHRLGTLRCVDQGAPIATQYRGHFLLPPTAESLDHLADDTKTEWQAATQLGYFKALWRQLGGINLSHSRQQLHALLQAK